ncbi:3'-5' exonuclease [Lutibacter sp. TH_r2]|uniref:3'-5' exonuclease n=1 Tax=Lutibacter sp. TH_r2 TaxID=3082083 RepID=UPI0029537C7A|nr:3'-5' exonuclease [Lutibacter sp. TH_r2]MDV7188449.1 3'-5' exonuclease [Lutibacter sp. TH_r2]
MIRFFKRKKQPIYWKNYVSKVENCTKYANFENIRFVALDTETTGFDFNEDRVLSIGAIALESNKILVKDSFEIFIKQDVFKKESVKIHGIRKNGLETKFEEEEALKQFLEYLDDAVIIAHHTAFDVTMINQALKRYNAGPLISKSLDTNYIHKKMSNSTEFNKIFSLDELCVIYNVKPYDRHNAAGDALLTAQVFLKLLGKYKKNNALNLKNLIDTSYPFTQ